MGAALSTRDGKIKTKNSASPPMDDVSGGGVGDRVGGGIEAAAALGG